MFAKQTEQGQPGQVRMERDGHVAWFIWDGANDLNAATPQMYHQLYGHLRDFRDDKDLWVGVMTGAGERAFSVGGDLKAMQQVNESFTARDTAEHFWYPRSEHPRRTPQVAEEIFDLELFKPMIGAVDGYCLGGGLVFLLGLTDIRVCSAEASFGFAEVRHGLGGGAGLSGIARQIGRSHAMYLCLTGATIDAAEAHRIGLVNEIVADGSARDRAAELARELCQISPTVLKIEKELLLRSTEMSRRDGLRLSWLMHFAQRHGDGDAGGGAG